MWQLNALNSIAPQSRPATKERGGALARVLRQYVANQQSGAPVHTWSLEVS